MWKVNLKTAPLEFIKIDQIKRFKKTCVYFFNFQWF